MRSAAGGPSLFVLYTALVVSLIDTLPHVSALPTDPLTPHTAGDGLPAAPRGCKLLSSVTYSDRWGPIFVEDDFECDFPPLEEKSSPPSSGGDDAVDVDELDGLDGDEADPFHRTILTPIDPRTTEYHRSSSQRLLSDRPTTLLPSNLEKHQITSYGCTSLPHPHPLDPTKGASLLWSITQLTNQSCLLPGHLRQYREIPREWSPDWAFSNMNRGEEVICDWYTELANVASALHFYCEHSLERERIGKSGEGGEILAYGRDKEREGQFWCMRYTKRGPGEQLFEEKCLGL